MKVNIENIYQYLRGNSSFCCSNGRWNLSQLLNREISSDNPASFEEMLPLWIGKQGLKFVDQERVDQYHSYLRKFFHDDKLAIFYQRIQEMFPGKPTEESISCYHTIVIIEWLIRDRKDSSFRLAEIGIGYGRIGEYIARYHSSSQYWGFDCVPESIFYAHAHLQKIKSTNLFLNTSDILAAVQSNEQSLNIAPGDLIAKLPKNSMDIIINVASIQEMPVEVYQAYWDRIPAVLAKNGHFIFINSRNHYYKREYYVPENMAILIKDFSPRSRSSDYPIEIYKKGYSNLSPCDAQNLLTKYYSSLKERLALENEEKIKQLKMALNKQISQKLVLKEAHKQKNKQVERLKDQIIRLRNQILLYEAKDNKNSRQ